MPVHNAARYLTDALESLLGQDFKDFELIISDNASTDSTPEVIRSYVDRDPRIKAYFQSENIGPARNDNFVQSKAVAPLFKWAAHDDLYAPEYLRKCIDILEQDKDVCLTYTKTWIIDEDGNVVSPYEDNFHLVSPLPHIRYDQYLRAMALLNPFYGVIRSAVLSKVMPLASYASADKVLLGELALHGKFYEVPERLFYRRIHSGKSTVVQTTDEQWDQYYNPKHLERLPAPRFKRFTDHLRSIHHSPLTSREHIQCYRVLLAFYLTRERFPGLLKDLINFRLWLKQRGRDPGYR